MVTYGQIQELVNFKSEDVPVVSVYLNTDLRQLTPDEIRLHLKDMIQERKKEVLNQQLTHQQEESLKQDFNKLLTFIEEEKIPEKTRGMVIFSCSAKNFWQVYRLPQRVKDALIVDPDAYVRPLMAILNQYHRLAFVLVDRRRAQVFELYMGEILDRSDQLSDDVPGKVRFAGWYGLEEKRVMRHIEDHIHRHYKRVADFIWTLYNQQHIDYFILGGHPHELPDFEHHLHRYIYDRIIERVDTAPFAWDVNKIKQTALEIEQKFMFERLSKMIDVLITDAQKGEKAVLGLDAVLNAANMGNIRLLMIEEDRVLPGYECFNCGYLSRTETTCPVCGTPMEKMDDLYDEIVENTVNFNGDYYQVPKGISLAEYGGVGAFTRFKLEEK